MMSSWLILNPASVSLFIEEHGMLMFILGFVAGADLGMIFAALMLAAGKEKDE